MSGFRNQVALFGNQHNPQYSTGEVIQTGGTLRSVQVINDGLCAQ